jgi:multicomponent Na+:H+ antiporter subunit A
VLYIDPSVPWPEVRGDITYYQAALAVLLVLAPLAAVRSADRFVAILALSIGGYAIALLYLLFGAPDLALTQFSVETLSLILLVIVLIHLPAVKRKDPAYARVRDAVVAGLVGLTLTGLMLTVLSHPLDRYLSEAIAARSYTEAQGHNIVNVILVDFRAIDTMGEITVLTMAALGVYVLMRMPRAQRPAFDLHGDGAPPTGEPQEIPRDAERPAHERPDVERETTV